MSGREMKNTKGNVGKTLVEMNMGSVIVSIISDALDDDQMNCSFDECLRKGVRLVLSKPLSEDGVREILGVPSQMAGPSMGHWIDHDDIHVQGSSGVIGSENIPVLNNSDPQAAQGVLEPSTSHGDLNVAPRVLVGDTPHAAEIISQPNTSSV
ncbi:hypothetical protein Drorol1_Dr00025163 [Drosera rotundifolia]